MMRLFAILLLFLLGAGCERYPRDPRGTLERVSGGELRAGIVGDGTRERELVRELAAEIHAGVSWRDGSEHDLLASLEREIDVVGGLAEDSPWRERVALTRSYEGKRTLAVAPGENAFLLRIERVIAQRSTKR